MMRTEHFNRRVAIWVENRPLLLVAPTSFIALLQASADYKLPEGIAQAESIAQELSSGIRRWGERGHGKYPHH